MAFLVSVFIARILGAEGNGIYSMALAVATVGSIVGRLGLDNAVLRFVAIHSSQKEWYRVIGVHSLAFKVGLLGSGLVSLFLFLCAEWIAKFIFGNGEITTVLRWMSLTIVPFAMLNLEAQTLKGMKRIIDAMLVQGVLVPFLMLLMLYPVASYTGTLGITWIYLFATITTFLVGWARYRIIIMPLGAEEISDFSFKTLRDSCRHLYPVALINGAIIPWGPLMILGVWVSPDETGIFAAATRISMLVSILLTTIVHVVAPMFAQLYSKGDLGTLARVYRFSSIAITLTAIPLFLPMFFYGDWVMTIFGPDFAVGGTTLAILAVGQIFNAAFGPVGVILNMSGNEATTARITLVSLVWLLLVAFLLIPKFGMIGAAISSSCGFVVFNILAFSSAQKKLGINLGWV
jgi:O-antigen/teichoic acid export membrane protein